MKNQLNMQSIILEVLEEIACPNTGTCQINMQSSSAREMIAKKLVDKLEPFVHDQTSNLIEDIICSSGDYVGEV
jgi:hypothetical protein